MNLRHNFSVGIQNLAAIIRRSFPLSVLLLTACLSGGGTTTTTGGSSGGADSISATANTTAQSLTVDAAMSSLLPLSPSGGTTPYTYSYGGTLPAGLSLNASTGAVTGTPTATYSTANVVFSVQDAKGVVANTTSSVSFTVGAASATITATANTTTQSLTVGTAMTSFSPLLPSGGFAPYTYSITSGTLPPGLSFNTGTGAVTGTPNATYVTANVVFSVRDANNVVAITNSTVSFTAIAASTTISATANTTAQSLTVGTAMASFLPLTPSGGTIPYTYSVISGTLPTGLIINTSTGALTGTPTSIYTTANVVFSVRDANSVVASTTSTVIFTVGAASTTIIATATTTTQSLTVGTAMSSFSPLTPSGGTTPYAYSYSGTLPAGLSFDTTTGAVTGTPSTPYSAANVVFSVMDANTVTASTNSTVLFTVAALPTGYVLQGGLTWKSVSGTTTYSYPQATTLCAGTINGQTGVSWRLPTLAELNAFYTAYPNNSTVLVNQGWMLGYTWTSTPNGVSLIFSVNLYDGVVISMFDTLSGSIMSLGTVTCVH